MRKLSGILFFVGLAMNIVGSWGAFTGNGSRQLADWHVRPMWLLTGSPLFVGAAAGILLHLRRREKRSRP